MPDLFQIQLVHLTRLYLQPAFKAHAWHQAKTLEAGHGEVFRGLCEALTTSVRQSREKSD
jgi:hypothetical protein